jgi:hypothetical protein
VAVPAKVVQDPMFNLSIESESLHGVQILTYFDDYDQMIGVWWQWSGWLHVTAPVVTMVTLSL